MQNVIKFTVRGLVTEDVNLCRAWCSFIISVLLLGVQWSRVTRLDSH